MKKKRYRGAYIKGGMLHTLCKTNGYYGCLKYMLWSLASFAHPENDDTKAHFAPSPEVCFDDEPDVAKTIRVLEKYISILKQSAKNGNIHN